LGVGDGWPSTRNHSAFLYRFGGTRLLMDCGEPVSRCFDQTGVAYDAIDSIFLSHLHFDHIGGFFMLMQSFWLRGRTRDLPIHLPRAGITPIRKLLEAACLFDELLGFRLSYQPLRAGQPVTVQGVRVTPFLTTHLASFRAAFGARYRQKFEAFSFLIEAGALRIGHSADLGAPEDLGPLVSAPLDLLVCELAHFKPEHLFRYLRQHEIKRILFVHLTRKQWEQTDKLGALATSLLGGIPFSFARDHEELPCLRPATGSKAIRARSRKTRQTKLNE